MAPFPPKNGTVSRHPDQASGNISHPSASFTMDDALWDGVMDSNLKGCFPCLPECGSLNDATGKRRHIILDPSMRSPAPLILCPIQRLKAPVANAHQQAHNIRVNCVHPGWILTEGEIAVQRAQGMADKRPDQAAAWTARGHGPRGAGSDV